MAASLTAYAAAMAATLTPPNFAFPPTKVSASSSTMFTVSVTPGTAVGTPQIDGQDRASFSASGSIPAGGSYQIIVTCTPQHAGNLYARVKVLVTTNGIPGWAWADLTGRGV